MHQRFWIGYICFLLIGAGGISLLPQLSAQDQKPKAEEKEARTVVILPCKYVKAADMERFLSAFLKDQDRIGSEEATNSVVISGSKASIEQCKSLLEQMDKPPMEPKEVTQLLQQEANFIKQFGNLINRYAGSNEVEIVLQEDIGLVMVKGTKEKVNETLEFIQELRQMNRVESPRRAPSKSVAIRVIWLTNGPRPTDPVAEVDPMLQSVIDRLGKLGIKNLAVGMQLLSRCDPSVDGEGSCKVSGRNGTGEVTVDAQIKPLFEPSPKAATPNAHVPAKEVYQGRIEIQALQIQGNGPLTAMQMDVQVEVGKYYVLSSAPAGSHSSVFVLQLIEDL